MDNIENTSPTIIGSGSHTASSTLLQVSSDHQHEHDGTTLSNRNRTWCQRISKTLFGLAIVIGIAVSWVGSTQFASSTYSTDFFAPSFNVWFSTLWMSICYPVYLVWMLVFNSGSRSRCGVISLHRVAERIYGPDGLNMGSFLKLSGSFCFCWAITNYLYVYALGLVAPADVTALFSSNTAFIYILSWLWLNERVQLLPARGLSVLLSIGGIVLISYAEGFAGPTAAGVVLSIGSAIGAAVYKVLFKRIIGDATYGQVSLFLSMISFFNLLFLWPFFILFYFTGFETIDWYNIPWDFLCGSAALSVVFNFLINFGIAVTFPLFIALGTVIGIPLNAVVDYIFRDLPFGWYKIGGTMFIVGGFIIMVLPETWQEMCWPKRQQSGEQEPLISESRNKTAKSC